MSNNQLNVQLHKLTKQALASSNRNIGLLYTVYEALVRATQRHIEASMRSVLGSQSGISVEDVLQDFFITKLADLDFVKGLFQSSTPAALLWRAAGNFARTYRDMAVRDPVSKGLRKDKAEGLPEDEWISREVQSRLSDEAEGGVSEKTLACRAEWASLPDEDRLFLAVTYIEHDDLEDGQISFLANERGVTKNQVVSELNDRAKRYRERRTEICRVRDKHFGEMTEKQIRIRETTEALKSAQDPPAKHPRTIEEALAQMRKTKALTTYHRPELEAYLKKLEGQLKKLEKDHMKRKDDSEQGIPPEISDGRSSERGSPDWEEVGSILGVIGPSDNGGARKTKTNTLTVRHRRLLSRCTSSGPELGASARGRSSS